MDDLLTSSLERLPNGVVILRLSGEIDLATANSLIQRLTEISDEPPSDLIIDATDVGFMDSSGVHALIVGKGLVHAKNCRITLVVSEPVRRVLNLTYPDHQFATRVDSLSEAMELISDKPADVGQE